MNIGRILFFSMAIFAWATVVNFGISCAAEVSETPTSTSEIKTEDSNSKGKASSLGLDNFRFGVGLSVTLNGGGKRVTEAEVVNGIVRVTREQSAIPRVLLETHYLFNRPDWGSWCTACGLGPFIALQPGSDDVIDAIGAGVMIAFRENKDDKASWNIGLGCMIDTQVKVLGDGIEEGKPLPAGETQIRFKEQTKYGWLIFASFSW